MENWQCDIFNSSCCKSPYIHSQTGLVALFSTELHSSPSYLFVSVATRLLTGLVGEEKVLDFTLSLLPRKLLSPVHLMCGHFLQDLHGKCVLVVDRIMRNVQKDPQADLDSTKCRPDEPV